MTAGKETKAWRARGYRRCRACKEYGTKPKRGEGLRLVFDPMITMVGTPTIENHRLGAEFMAERVWHLGVQEQIDDYALTREHLVLVCWWAGQWGPLRLRKVFRDWSGPAGWHLWYGCIQIPDPPRKWQR